MTPQSDSESVHDQQKDRLLNLANQENVQRNEVSDAIPVSETKETSPEENVPALRVRYRLKGRMNRYAVNATLLQSNGVNFTRLRIVERDFGKSREDVVEGQLILEAELKDEWAVKMFAQKLIEGSFELDRMTGDKPAKSLTGKLDQADSNSKDEPPATASPSPAQPADVSASANPNKSSKKLLNHLRPRREQSAPPTAPDPFLANVPDFVQADWNKVRPMPFKLEKGRPRVARGMHWLGHLLTIAQKRAYIIIPDTLAAQTTWGANRNRWPANWRHFLDHALGNEDNPKPAQKECPPECPLHGRQERHMHFRRKFTGLGVLDLFAYDDELGQRRYNWSPALKEGDAKQKQIKEYRKKGQLAAVYLPVLLFGPSPRSGMSHEQKQLLVAISHELTRSSGMSRPDKGQIITGGQRTIGNNHVAVYPGLQPGQTYLGFNGNGSYNRKTFRGKGYRLIGKTAKGWIKRAGYAVPEDDAGRWASVKRLLSDLQALSDPFGLIVAGWNGEKRQWWSLAEMQAGAMTDEGKRWLDRCLMRIYTPDDCLERWRNYFAAKLGFSSIPGGSYEDGPEEPRQHTKGIHSAIDLNRWMRQVGMSNQELAKELSVTDKWVSLQRSGKKPWSKHFANKVMAFMAKRDASSGSSPMGN